MPRLTAKAKSRPRPIAFVTLKLTAVQRSDPFRAQPIGTGPYRFVRFNSDNSVTLAAHAENRKPPRIPEVTLREVADKNYQAKLLLYETLEALVRVLPRDLAILQNNRGVELHPYQTNAWWYLGFNLSRPTWADPRAREALALMVDRQALLAPVGTGDLLSGPFVRSSPYYNHEVSDWRPDPAKAAALLEAAGYRRDGASWTRNGQPAGSGNARSGSYPPDTARNETTARPSTPCPIATSPKSVYS